MLPSLDLLTSPAGDVVLIWVEKPKQEGAVATRRSPKENGPPR